MWLSDQDTERRKAVCLHDTAKHKRSHILRHFFFYCIWRWKLKKDLDKYATNQNAAHATQPICSKQIEINSLFESKKVLDSSLILYNFSHILSSFSLIYIHSSMSSFEILVFTPNQKAVVRGWWKKVTAAHPKALNFKDMRVPVVGKPIQH
jgi:hypothetical protein